MASSAALLFDRPRKRHGEWSRHDQVNLLAYQVIHLTFTIKWSSIHLNLPPLAHR